MQKTYPRLTKPCSVCGYIMTDSVAPDCEENGGGWWYCMTCEVEILPESYGFRVYDTVEIIGATWEDGSKVIGAVKGFKEGKLGVSTDSFYSFFLPEKLKLIRRLENGKWIDG